jgi:hypothetical protein
MCTEKLPQTSLDGPQKQAKEQGEEAKQHGPTGERKENSQNKIQVLHPT